MSEKDKGFPVDGSSHLPKHLDRSPQGQIIVVRFKENGLRLVVVGTLRALSTNGTRPMLYLVLVAGHVLSARRSGRHIKTVLL